MGRMMRYLSRLFLFAAALVPTVVFGQLSEPEMNMIGLETAWISQARVPAYGPGIVSSELWINDTSTQKYAVVELPNESLVRVSASKLDQLNQPIGIEKAKAEAQAIAVRLTGQQTSFEVAETNIPEIRLVIVTSNGLVQNFDGESGKLLWATPCGPLNVSAIPAALTTAGVLVVQGDSLYQLDWTTGKQVAVRTLLSSTGRSLTVIEGRIAPPSGSQRNVRIKPMAVVTDFSGGMSAYGITEKMPQWTSKILGRPNMRSAMSPDRQLMAVSTSAGMVYVFNGAEEPKVQFRYESRGELTDCLVAGKDAFYIGSSDGSFAKVSFTGQLVWTFRHSNAITAPALIDQENNLAFLSSESGELTALDIETGNEAWESSVNMNFRGPIAIAGANVICRTVNDGIVAVDRKSGRVVSNGQRKGNVGLLPAMLLNTLTDRVYVASSNGRIQCLRPTGRDIPKVYKPIVSAPTKPQAAELTPEAKTAEPVDPNADPFGASMGTGAEPAPSGDTSDPFGSDPLGSDNP
jgi:outer membrane protein assembly factor BamB